VIKISSKTKQCNKCKLNKGSDCFYRNKKSKDGLRPNEYRLYIMSSQILRRLKYCHWDGYEHLNCYKEKNIECELGDTVEEVKMLLDKYFKEDILKLIEQGKTPTVDRVDSNDNYRLGNIRIIDYYENSILGFKNANDVRKKMVKATYPSGKSLVFESLNEAGRNTGLYKSSIKRIIERKGLSREEKIKFEFI
jgi:hypothetical protein